MYTALITGANRGIGLALTEQYLKDGWKVIACCRELLPADLVILKQTYTEPLQICALDVGKSAQIEYLASTLKGVTIDVLINNAGVYPESTLGEVNEDEWMHAFEINSMAPLKMAEAFLPHVAASDLKKLVTLTTKMGSLADNTSGGSYIYRSSKAAANMVMKSLSIDLKAYGIACCALHPGWVLTDMGGPNALINTEQSAAGLRKVIDELSIENAGRFIAYDGKVIPW